MRRVVEDDGSVWYEVLGQLLTEEDFDRQFGPSAGSPDAPALVGWKPIHSEALAYHPRQINEATKHLAKLGVPTEIDNLGRPVLRTRQHRKQLLKALQLHDNQGGYGDG